MLSSWLTTAALASCLSIVAAQSIDPNSVPLSMRQFWCDSQETQCPLICLQTPGNSAATESNTCDPSTLDYSCVCSNGMSPNASQYSQTIPYYICTQANTDCVNACGNDNSCASACRQDHPCGAQNPTRVNTSTITTMSATATGSGSASSGTGVVYSGFGGGAAATSAAGSGNGSSAATRLVINFGEVYGLLVLGGSIFAGFTLML